MKFLLKSISLNGGLELPDGEEFVSKVFPNIWAFLVQFLAFIVMMLIVIKFAYKPVSRFLSKRREYIADNLRQADEKNAKAEANVLDSMEQLSRAKKEAVEMIGDAEKEAQKERERLMQQAQEDIARKKEKAREEIEREEQKAIRRVHDEVVSLAYETSKSILQREVSDEDDKKMVDDFVHDLMEKK